QPELAQFAHRRVRSGETGRGETATRTARRETRADPPGSLRPDRPAADARGGRGVPPRRIAECLREGRGPAAEVAALRGAVGPALAGRGSLRRGPGAHLRGQAVHRSV